MALEITWRTDDCLLLEDGDTGLRFERHPTKRKRLTVDGSNMHGEPVLKPAVLREVVYWLGDFQTATATKEIRDAEIKKGNQDGE